MDVKPLEIPERANVDAALKRRIDSFHKKRREIEDDYHLRMTGYRGEKEISYFLNKLPQDEYNIINNLRLKCPNSDSFFQMDKLLLSTFIPPLNIEVKTWKCDIHFDQHLDQVIKVYPEKNKRERAQNPVLQAREQATQLGLWLAHQGFGTYPIEYLFTNSNNKSIITTDSGNEHVLKKVCTSENLTYKINQIAHLTKPLTKATLNEITEALLASHTPPVYDIQKMYNISQNEVLHGVHCPKCLLLAMLYKNGIWICPHCNYQSKTAHIPTLNDYFLLIKPTITNAEFRQFFNMNSSDNATRILHSLNLPHIGSTKGRIYFKPEKLIPFYE